MIAKSKLGIFAVVTTSAALVYGASNAQDMTINRASFASGITLNKPSSDDYRQWTYIGTPLTPNALNGGEAPFPEFHNVYMETSAYLHFAKTGEFPDGTQLAKELVSVRASDDCDETNGSCFEVSGQGYFQGEFIGLEMAIKDATLFADEPGNWAYYSFGHVPPAELAATAEPFPAESCNSCHEASADNDFIFTQFYPVLRAADPNLK